MYIHVRTVQPWSAENSGGYYAKNSCIQPMPVKGVTMLKQLSKHRSKNKNRYNIKNSGTASIKEIRAYISEKKKFDQCQE
jgi:hypothetical protein